MEGELNSEGKFDFTGKLVKQVTIFQERKTKEFFLAIIYKEETPSYHNNGKYLAIDHGVINIIAATNSHSGKSFTIKND